VVKKYQSKKYLLWQLAAAKQASTYFPAFFFQHFFSSKKDTRL